MIKVVCVLVVRNGKILLGKRSKSTTYPGVYCTPGGKIEPNETDSDAAERELFEETHLTCDIVPFIKGIVEEEYDFRFMYATNVIKEPVNTEPHKCEGWEWIDLDLAVQTTPGLVWLRTHPAYEHLKIDE